MWHKSFNDELRHAEYRRVNKRGFSGECGSTILRMTRHESETRDKNTFRIFMQIADIVFAALMAYKTSHLNNNRTQTIGDCN